MGCKDKKNNLINKVIHRQIIAGRTLFCFFFLGDLVYFNFINLFKAYSGASNFKQILFIHQKLSFCGIIHVVYPAQLVIEEGFSYGSKFSFITQFV